MEFIDILKIEITLRFYIILKNNNNILTITEDQIEEITEKK